MNRFTRGLIAGSLVGAAGIVYAMQDRRTRSRVLRDGRKVMHKAGDIAENIADKF